MTKDNAELIARLRKRSINVGETEGNSLYRDSADALVTAAAERDAGWRMVEWGVQVGTWPPTQYATLDMAKFYAERPFNGFEEYPHVVVTRNVVSFPWEEATS